nr:serine/threonine protein kinase [candidate division Zixibacteria bacterium]
MEEQFIGNYKILKKIGSGGMARVYLAVHKDVPNLKVVLKILSDPGQADRFRQEADKLALLDGHSNICRIKHFFNHGEDFVIAMEYIDGVTLEEKVEKEGKFSIEESLRITSEVLDILEVAHQKDIYHRDIKPSNIMIDLAGHIKIIDFGIAKGKSDPSLTMAGTACGTPAYMSPEQFTGNENIDYALADIYAAGTMLYFLLTCEVPFKGDNQFLIRDAKLTKDPQSPRKINSEIPRDLEAVIMKSLKRDPRERYQSACEMKEALVPIMRKYAAADEDKTAAVPVTRPEGEKSKTVPVLIGVAAVAMVAFGLWLFWPSGGNNVQTKEVISQPEVVTDERQVTNADSSNVAIEPEVSPVGTIALTIEPSGDIYLNDMLIGRNVSETTFNADTGQYVMRVENKKAVPQLYESDFYLSSDENFSRQFTFEFPKPAPVHEPPPVAVDSGWLLVGSKPFMADIYLDGQLQSETTPYTFHKPVGEYTVRITLDKDGENIDRSEKAVVRKNDTSRVIFDTTE